MHVLSFGKKEDIIYQQFISNEFNTAEFNQRNSERNRMVLECQVVIIFFSVLLIKKGKRKIISCAKEEI